MEEKHIKNTSKLSETLPQTGEAQEIVLVIIGAVLIILLGCLVWAKGRRMRRK